MRLCCTGAVPQVLLLEESTRLLRVRGQLTVLLSVRTADDSALLFRATLDMGGGAAGDQCDLPTARQLLLQLRSDDLLNGRASGLSVSHKSLLFSGFGQNHIITTCFSMKLRSFVKTLKT